MCSAHHHLGIAADGGFATHVLVPHPRYLIDYAPLAAAFAGPLMCSGLTAYAALKRLASRAQRGPALLVGPYIAMKGGIGTKPAIAKSATLAVHCSPMRN